MIYLLNNQKIFRKTRQIIYHQNRDSKKRNGYCKKLFEKSILKENKIFWLGQLKNRI